MTWKVMPRNVWNDIVILQTGRLNNSTKYLLHASMTTTSKKKKWNLLENCHKYAPKLFWNAYTWHVLGALIFLWSVTKLARSATKWTQACDRRLSRLISYIHHTSEYKQYCHVGNTANSADWDCFKTPTLQEILRTRNLLQVEHCAFPEAIHLFQIAGCVRNKLQFRTVQLNQKSFLWMQV